MAHTWRLAHLCTHLDPDVGSCPAPPASPAPTATRPEFDASLRVQPDLLTSLAGSPVTAQGWARRREELENAVIPHQFGGMPPLHESVEVYARGHVRALSDCSLHLVNSSALVVIYATHCHTDGVDLTCRSRRGTSVEVESAPGQASRIARTRSG